LHQTYHYDLPGRLPPVDAFRSCPLCKTDLQPAEIGDRIRQTCPACGYIHFINPFPTVSVTILKDGQVLLGKRRGEPGQGKWAMPSGYIEQDEDFLTAAVREAKEETGLDIVLRGILNVESAFIPPDYYFLTVHLLAEVVGGELSANDDLAELGWYPLAGPLPELAFAPDADVIRACAAGDMEKITVSKRSK
jgi:ADP-ribose pyrophosphatase YjhB (NUDIX family)